jgi:redox-sensitive bicupin YhaK (pirin superfamily)
MVEHPDGPMPNTDDTPIDMVIVPPTRSLGDGFEVRRALPSAKRRMVGPFVFFDQMGPTVLNDGRGLDVRPHPHIGLATVTYLMEGELMHRDSLGTLQTIFPGDVNWMTAGSGIVHSERSPMEARQQQRSLFGLQAWVALPEHEQEAAASFSHIGKARLPVVEGEGKLVRVIAGSLFGSRAPVDTYSDMFYGDATLQQHARLEMTAEHEERALYLIDGEVSVAGQDGTFHPGQLVVLRPGAPVTIQGTSSTPARLMLLGGEPLGPRIVWWNFVSSSKGRIEQAKEDWEAGRFAAVPGENEHIPLPDPAPPVDYP